MRHATLKKSRTKRWRASESGVLYALRLELLERQDSMTQIARSTGLSVRSLNNLAFDMEFKPRLDTIELVADYFGLSVEAVPRSRA